MAEGAGSAGSMKALRGFEPHIILLRRDEQRALLLRRALQARDVVPRKEMMIGERNGADNLRADV